MDPAPDPLTDAPPFDDAFYRDALMQLVNERTESNVLLDRIASALETIAVALVAGRSVVGLEN